MIRVQILGIIDGQDLLNKNEIKKYTPILPDVHRQNALPSLPQNPYRDLPAIASYPFLAFTRGSESTNECSDSQVASR
jgi:hypothetical protein